MDGSTPINSIRESIAGAFRKAWEGVLERLSVPPSGRVLCCGRVMHEVSVYLASSTASKIFLMGSDPAPEQVDSRVVRLDAEYSKILPAFPDRTFQNVFVFWPEPEFLACLDQVARVLKPEGHAVLLVARDRSPDQLYEVLDRLRHGTEEVQLKTVSQGFPRSARDLRTMLDHAKLLDHRVWEEHMSFSFQNPSEAWRNLDVMGVESMVSTLPPEWVVRIKSSMTENMEKEIQSFGRCELNYPYLGTVIGGGGR